MAIKKPLSETAQWFLKDFRRILDDFSNELGFQVVVINKRGDLINETKGVQAACKMIMSTEEGKTRCNDHFKTALSSVKNSDKPIFSECYACFSSVWMPIVIKGYPVGVIIRCGGRYDKGEGNDIIVKKISKLADELGIMHRQDFIKSAIDDVLTVDKAEIEKQIEKLNELFDILSGTAPTPLKEVFG